MYLAQAVTGGAPESPCQFELESREGIELDGHTILGTGPTLTRWYPAGLLQVDNKYKHGADHHTCGSFERYANDAPDGSYRYDISNAQSPLARGGTLFPTRRQNISLLIEWSPSPERPMQASEVSRYLATRTCTLRHR